MYWRQLACLDTQFVEIFARVSRIFGDVEGHFVDSDAAAGFRSNGFEAQHRRRLLVTVLV